MIAAFFDIDGTIFRNSLLTEHFKKLIKYDLLDFSEYDRRVKEAFKLWDERVGNYDNYLGDLTGTYVDAIKGLPTKYNDFVADKVVELKGNKVYAYTRKMIKWHKAQGHLVIFISGSPDFLVSRMAKKWNADDFCGSTYHTDKSGILTGEISPMWDSKNKLKSIHKFCESDTVFDMACADIFQFCLIFDCLKCCCRIWFLHFFCCVREIFIDRIIDPGRI